MITVQFFEEHKEIASGPLTEKEGSLGIFEVDYDPSYQDVILEDGKPVIIDISIPPGESFDSKKSRITQLLITSENYEEVDTEGVTFEKPDIGPMIIARFFGGDPNAEMAYLKRWNYLKDTERSEVQEVELEIIKQGYKATEEFKNFIQSLT